MLDGALLDGPVLKLSQPHEPVFQDLAPCQRRIRRVGLPRDREGRQVEQVGLLRQRVHEDATPQGGLGEAVADVDPEPIEDRLAGVEEQDVIGVLRLVNVRRCRRAGG